MSTLLLRASIDLVVHTDMCLVGHTKVRCKEPLVEDTTAGGDSGNNDFGNNTLSVGATFEDPAVRSTEAEDWTKNDSGGAEW